MLNILVGWWATPEIDSFAYCSLAFLSPKGRFVCLAKFIQPTWNSCCFESFTFFPTYAVSHVQCKGMNCIIRGSLCAQSFRETVEVILCICLKHSPHETPWSFSSNYFGSKVVSWICIFFTLDAPLLRYLCLNLFILSWMNVPTFSSASSALTAHRCTRLSILSPHVQNKGRTAGEALLSRHTQRTDTMTRAEEADGLVCSTRRAYRW